MWYWKWNLCLLNAKHVQSTDLFWFLNIKILKLISFQQSRHLLLLSVTIFGGVWVILGGAWGLLLALCCSGIISGKLRIQMGCQSGLNQVGHRQGKHLIHLYYPLCPYHFVIEQSLHPLSKEVVSMHA